MKPKHLLYFALIAGISACNKTEGPGGTSTITGFVKTQSHEDGRPEITEIICSPGLEVEHGDYFVINNPAGLTQYYIYFDNPGWVSESNPFLEGRTGIEVSFDYSDSNVEIATNTAAALTSFAAGDFTITRNVDIITLKGKVWGDAPDADKVSSPFEVNTAQQGRSEITTQLHPAVDEKVYLVYGEQTVYGDMERTGGDGEYEFKNLTPGNYKVYSVKTDKTTGVTTKFEKSVEITEKKSIVVADEIKLIP